MTAVNHLVKLWLLLPMALIFFVLSTEQVQAQSTFKPIPSGASASVFIEGKAFYIQAGLTTTGFTNQTFSISLSSSWDVLNPAYTKLPNGLYDSRFPNTLLKDGISWFAISNKNFVTYNISDGKLTQRNPAIMYSNLQGLGAVLDRGTGEVIIPNGFTNGAQTTTLYITPENLSTRTDPQPAQPQPALTGLTQYSLAWSESAQKANVGAPSARVSPCMVPAFNGTKLILFGGSSPIGAPLSDIFIYDVAGGKWTPGADGLSGRARSSHACAVSGDALIVWGGFENIPTRSPPPNTVAVYNLTLEKWVDRYNAVPIKQVPTSVSAPTSLKPTSTAGSGSDSGPGSGSGNGNGPEHTPAPSGSGNSIGAIVGGSAAAVVVLTVLGFILWRRDQLKKRKTFIDVHDHQNNEGSPNYKEPTERGRDPHAGSNGQPNPQSANDARHPHVDKSQEQHGYGAEMQPAYGLQHPHTEMPEDQYQYGAEMQSAYGLRHPHSEIPQEHAPEMQPAYGVQPKFEVPQHGHGHHRQRNKGYYDFNDPVTRYNNPHGDLNARPAPRIPPRPAKVVRRPQLDISQRERELFAEMEMLQMDKGNAAAFAQPTDRWSVDRSGGATYHT
ncbi:hypothetical protein BGZ74_008580 [Mortierella antarctica]|nr:hypothetical protein BGZ74_008580 [Mortierella antarctica]